MDKGSAKERLIIKLVCVLLSFCLWIYVTNVETIVKTFTLKDVPVQIVNTEALKNYGLALVPGQQFEVNLNLEGPAKYIYSVKKTDFTIRADLSEYALKKGENTIPVQIVNYPQEVNIKDNGYLLVKVNLEPLETKTFKSVSEVNLTFAQNIYKDAVDFDSENIQVSGPASLVNQVTKVALVGSLTDISEPITRSFKYEALNSEGQIINGVKLSKTTGSIQVSTSTGKKVPISAQFTGSLPNGFTLVSTQLSTDSVTVVGDKQALSGLKSLSTAPIDLSGITDNTTKKANIILPAGVSISNGLTSVDVAIEVSKPDTNSENSQENNTQTDETTSKDITIPLTHTGLEKSLKLEKIPTSISVQVKGKASIINSLVEGDFTAVADLSSYKEAGTFDLTPKVTSSKDVTIESIPSINVVLSKVEVKSETEVKKQ